MFFLGVRYLRRNRLLEAIGTAGVLFLAIFAMWWVRSQGPACLERTEGTVIETFDSPFDTSANRLVRLRLTDGQEARVLVPTYLASAGTAVPVVVESYDDGPAYVSFDIEGWVDRTAGE